MKDKQMKITRKAYKMSDNDIAVQKSESERQEIKIKMS